jgi:hypothetical protein
MGRSRSRSRERKREKRPADEVASIRDYDREYAERRWAISSALRFDAVKDDLHNVGGTLVLFAANCILYVRKKMQRISQLIEFFYLKLIVAISPKNSG